MPSQIPRDDSRPVAHLDESTELHQGLHHPSIVSLYSSFSTSTAHYQVLEFCSLGTLASFLRGRKPPFLQEDELRGVMRSLVDALIYLRRERVLHRDIKAGNVLITAQFRIVRRSILSHLTASDSVPQKLADFGLAQRLPSEKATATTFCGSPNYVSPCV